MTKTWYELLCEYEKTALSELREYGHLNTSKINNILKQIKEEISARNSNKDKEVESVKRIDSNECKRCQREITEESIRNCPHHCYDVDYTNGVFVDKPQFMTTGILLRRR